jgi:hypothetical protein
MRYSHLTDAELWRGMAENSDAMSQIAKNQIDLAEGRIGMKDPAAGAQLMISNVRQIAHLRREYDNYYSELQRRYPGKGAAPKSKRGR